MGTANKSSKISHVMGCLTCSIHYGLHGYSQQEQQDKPCDGSCCFLVVVFTWGRQYVLMCDVKSLVCRIYGNGLLNWLWSICVYSIDL